MKREVVVTRRSFDPSGVDVFQYIEINGVSPTTGQITAQAISGGSVPSRAQQVCRAGDVIVSTVRPNRNAVAVITQQEDGFVCSSGFIVLRPKRVTPEYLFVYLKARPVVELLVRATKATMYPAVTEDDVLALPFIPPDDALEKDITSAVRSAFQKLLQSRQFYAQAEALLLAELGLDNLDLSHQLTYTQSASQVWAAGRLDAEYFQPKYYTLLDRLQKTGQAVRLGDWLREPVRRGVQPKYDENGKVIVINSQHVGKTHVELDDNRRTTKGFAEQNERAIVRPYDVLLNSTGYITIGRCQTFLDDVPAIVDGHVSIIRPKPGLDPVYLGLFLNSPPGQMQTERSWTGSSGQIELRSELVENYTVWKPDEALQRRIRRLVEDAHVARKQAKRLLEEAKRRVEEMVLGKGELIPEESKSN